MERLGGYMCTFTGRKYWPLDPRPEDIDVVDIAQALAMTCRYRGHCRRFYSVAEHSVLVSRAVSPQHALAGLLHDATEAYLGDMASPIKQDMAEYRAIETANAAVIARRFGLAALEPPEVKAADKRIVANEVPVLFESIEPFRPLPLPLPGVVLRCWMPAVAIVVWIERFAELTGGGPGYDAVVRFRNEAPAWGDDGVVGEP